MLVFTDGKNTKGERIVSENDKDIDNTITQRIINATEREIELAFDAVNNDDIRLAVIQRVTEEQNSLMINRVLTEKVRVLLGLQVVEPATGNPKVYDLSISFDAIDTGWMQQPLPSTREFSENTFRNETFENDLASMVASTILSKNLTYPLRFAGIYNKADFDKVVPEINLYMKINR